MKPRHYQIVVDENMHRGVVALLRKWTKAGQIGHEVAKKAIGDDQIIPRLLLRVGRTTLITQDQDIYQQHTPHAGYCLVVLPRGIEPSQLSDLAHSVFRTEGFRTTTERLGKVARVAGNRVIWREVKRTGEYSRSLAKA